MQRIPENDSDVPAPERTGQIVDGRYAIDGELGRGSTGAVWAARDLTTGECVALKVLHEDLSPSPAARRRFHREVVSATALSHQHSIRVLGAGCTADGADYLVMELAEGRTLSALLAERGPLPQLRAIRIIAQILEATAAAHKLGVVHRDLKPGNIMLVDHDGREDFVKVCDYGLAKVFETNDEATTGRSEGAAFATVPGVMCGTPGYMSPEQARGGEIDGRTDLYAIGVMLFQMVVGRLPFEASTAVDIVSAHLSETPPRPRALRPDLGIAPALENLILRAMAKDLRERPSSAEVMRADLLQVKRDLMRDERSRASTPGPVRAGDTLPASGPLPRPRSTTRRSRVVPGVVAVVVVVGALALAIRVRSTSAPAPVVANAVRETPPPTSAAAIPAPATLVQPRTPEAPPLVEQARPSVRAPKTTRSIKPARPEATPAAAAPDLLRNAQEALASGRLEDAKVLGLAAAERQQARPEVWEFLGRCYMRLGRPAEARTFYARYLALAPDGPEASLIRAIVAKGKSD